MTRGQRVQSKKRQPAKPRGKRLPRVTFNTRVTRQHGEIFAAEWFPTSFQGEDVMEAFSATELMKWPVGDWHDHRELVIGLLRELGARPNALRETIFWLIGRSIGIFCHIGGWFLPMYGAGRLERTNIVEYEEAAACALACGRADMTDCLLEMAEVEWEHERFFRRMILRHPLLRVFPLWDEPSAKESIRSRYEAIEGRGPAAA